ncbi:DNA polymerase III subunit delta' [Colwellia sp. RSH04]|uniref:DNA polymerase III subunit delta' n=1 Tax=Colwellia sp. RSH04 TaxID=2305464 RepID=UPI000E57DBB9|nr:DNA polymerase III subunit delta' [Colwellia sp. RSH04]RHW77064.1 DNA polymerase III subunit delta' [Colwellia sp. RSH04]
MNHQQLLSQQFSQKRLPHAILISGPKGSGKHVLAEWLTNLLSCNDVQQQANFLKACGHCKNCLLTRSQSYPDHLTLQSHTATIGVDDIRHSNLFLQKTAHIGQYKTVLIPNAETMTIAAANALLKTLEEPTADSVIILITHDIEQLLPTVVSRCRLFSIQPLAGEQLIAQAKNSNSSLSNIEKLDTGFVNISHIQELEDQQIYKEYLQFKETYIDFILKNGKNKALLEALQTNQHALRWLEKITCNLQRAQHLPEHSYVDLNNSKLTASVLNQLFGVIINANKTLKQYAQVNQQFVLEQLFFSMIKIVKS